MRPLYRDADRAREYPTESKVSYRSPFRRDYARLLHCPAFRRLQGKTQLFPGAESDFFRNRLTHSLEVAQIAKSIALRINSRHAYFVDNPIDLDLIETAALAHDLGHPPFGHNGERALDECMRKKGGFEGNAQTLRILARLEKKELDLEEAEETPKSEDRRVGLNLTYRTLAAVLKYDKCIPITFQTISVSMFRYPCVRMLRKPLNCCQGMLGSVSLRSSLSRVVDSPSTCRFRTAASWAISDSWNLALVPSVYWRMRVIHLPM